MGRNHRKRVVVITGASSGIGRATALEFAKQGCAVVIAARRKAALQDAARECREAGGEALVVQTEVTDYRQVENLARSANRKFGRIDVWVNNAGVFMVSRFEDTPLPVFRRLIDINLFGYVYGTRAVLRYFRQQKEGVLINVDSQIAVGAAPYNSAYATSKYAVRGFTDALRQELSDSGIHVCSVLPPSIDTPLFHEAANYTGKAIKPLGSVKDPREVAKAIVRLADDPKPEVMISSAAYVMQTLRQVAPRMYDSAMKKITERSHFQDAPAEDTPGNLFKPMPEYASVEGGWRKNGGKTAAKRIGIAGGAVATGLLAWQLYNRYAA